MSYSRVRSFEQLLRDAGLRSETIIGDPAVPVAGVVADSRRVTTGDVFVVMPGTHVDGATFIDEAIHRGASALVIDGRSRVASEHIVVPHVMVDDGRKALALLAAAWNDHPQRAVRIVGVTGTLGKTSTVALLEAILSATDAQLSFGIIGSLGSHVRGPAQLRIDPGVLAGMNGMTTPDATTLFATLRTFVDGGVELVIMEVTSHALSQQRIAGLELSLGIFTNLVPDEHLDYHGSAEDYVTTKTQFVDLLAPAAPLIINADDAVLQNALADRLSGNRARVIQVSAQPDSPRDAGDQQVAVSVQRSRNDAGGAVFAATIHRAIPRIVDGGLLQPCTFPIVLPVLGVQQVANAALATTAAIVVGADPVRITEALVEIEPIRRRMQVVRAANPLVIDDTTGNPETLRAVFATIHELPHSALRIVFGIRGMRGVDINSRLAASLGSLVRARLQEIPVTLVVSASADVTDARNHVVDNERDAMLDALRGRDVPFVFETNLADATRVLRSQTGNDDLVLLLGAQGMDRASELFLALYD